MGLISSFHCVGMCGSLALALPIHHLTPAQKTFSLLSYHAGRIAVYTIFGLIFGIAGRRIYIAGLQQAFSIALGIFILFVIVQYFVFKKSMQPKFLGKFYQNAQEVFVRYWKSPSKFKFILLGMTNGLLPCGMVYMAIAGALTASEIRYSVLFMAMFGAGTIPALVALSYFGSRIDLSMRNNIKKAIPFILGIMAVILVLRGLNLGIPFISPILAKAPAHAISCP